MRNYQLSKTNNKKNFCFRGMLLRMVIFGITARYTYNIVTS